MTIDRIRQIGLVNSEIFKTPVTIIGAGAIGSFTTLAMAKIGFADITIWDNDKIEEYNIPNQFYPLSMVGTNKVEALAKVVKDFEGIDIKINNEIYDGSKKLDNLVISAVDSMSARKVIFKGSEDAKWYIDGRMGKNQFEVYSVDLNKQEDIVAYNKTLWNDEDTAPVPCTEKAVMYNVLNVSSWIVNQARLLLSKKEYNKRVLFDLENMIMVTGDIK